MTACSDHWTGSWSKPLKDLKEEDEPKVVLGMFDPSARPCVPLDVLTMAFPMKRFEKAVGYVEVSFLITKEWAKVQKKIEQSGALHRKE